MLYDTEPTIATLLAARKLRRQQPPYTPCTEADVSARLTQFFADKLPASQVTNVARLGGGASKEQFIFSLTDTKAEETRYVLRMDPLEAVTETDRSREFQALAMFQTIVPVPKPLWLDADGSFFQRPAMIMAFVGGVTKPADNQEHKVSGLGTLLGPRVRELIRPQFMDNLIAIHSADWRKAALPSFAVPDADPQQSARWQLEYWAELWQQDGYNDPVMTLAEQWLRHNVPAVKELVFVHGDYRTGNYLFDNDTANITAILDWELAYIGDYHDDLAWVICPIFGTVIDGVFRASDLYSREEFISQYEKHSGRKVDRKTLHYYEVLTAYKCHIITLGSGYAVSGAAHNHQDVLLTFLAGAGPMFRADLCRLLREADTL